MDGKARPGLSELLLREGSGKLGRKKLGERGQGEGLLPMIGIVPEVVSDELNDIFV